MSLKTVLKVVASGPALAGLGMLAMASGLVDVDPKLSSVASVYTDPLNLPLKPFLIFVGATKVLSVLKLWDLPSLMPSVKLAVIGLACPAAAAVYGHYKVEGPSAAVPPIVYLGVLGAFWCTRDTGSVKKD